MRIRLSHIVVLTALVSALLAIPGVALAFDETTSTVPSPWDAANCGGCHDPWPDAAIGTGANVRIGVHGGYTTTTSKCSECHFVHMAPTSFLLLPGETIKATCFTCHDGTQGHGVYGAITARGVSVAASHSVETTNLVPGGDAATGGSKLVAFGGPSGTMTCTDCHSPHGADIVNPFVRERVRTGLNVGSTYTSSQLLKRRPGKATTPTAEYGSDWCLGCHQGRDAGLSAVHNHPADSISATPVASIGSTWTPFYYNNVARLNACTNASITTTGPLGMNNGGYLMPYPRTPQQTRHAPICQQCHEDARDPGSLNTTGNAGTVTPFIVNSTDGNNASDNPRFQTFPHETTAYRMLVEASATVYSDGLCFNCHPASQLP